MSHIPPSAMPHAAPHPHEQEAAAGETTASGVGPAPDVKAAPARAERPAASSLARVAGGLAALAIGGALAAGLIGLRSSRRDP